MSSKPRTLHVVEPGGQGGIYQHILGNAQNGYYSRYDRVVIHTAKDAELRPRLPGVVYDLCMRYQRKGPRPLRSVISLAWVLLVMLPSLLVIALIRNGDWEVQGRFGKGIYGLLVAVPSLLGRDVTWVPHNSFSRNDVWIDRLGTAIATKRAARIVVFVKSEEKKFLHAKEVVMRPLWQFLVTPTDAIQKAWDLKLRHPPKPTVLFIGQLRRDKNPLLLIQAANLIDTPLQLVFAGEDKGAAGEIHEFPLDQKHSLDVEDRYLKLEEFVAIIRSSDIVVCPYTVASQSGVIALATQIGRPVISSNVGGLSEQATFSFDVSSSEPALCLAEIMTKFLTSSFS